MGTPADNQPKLVEHTPPLVALVATLERIELAAGGGSLVLRLGGQEISMGPFTPDALLMFRPYLGKELRVHLDPLTPVIGAIP